MLSEEAYTLSNEGKILFTAGSKSASLTVTVKRNKLSYGNYVLPLKMTQCSSPYFEINPNKQSCLFGISYVPDESKLHPVTLSRGMTAIHPNREVEGKLTICSTVIQIPTTIPIIWKNRGCRTGYS